MMSDFDVLRDLIRDDMLAPIQDHYRKKTVVLKEPGNRQQSAYSLEIRNAPDNTIAFKADAFPSPKEIFKNSKGECKRADFVIIASNHKANWIVYIEMKSGKAGPENEIKKQLIGAQCLVAYCRAIGQGFWGKPQFLQENNYQQRFISVRNIGVPKRQTRTAPNSGQHDAPERMLKINAPSKNALEFYKLVGAP